MLPAKSDISWVLRFAVYKDLNNVDDIKIKGLRWSSHIIRKEGEMIPEKVLNGNFYNKRPHEQDGSTSS